MKDLLIATDFFLPRWDGVARFLSELIPEINDEYRIKVLAPAYPGRVPAFKNTEIIRFPLFNLYSFGDVTFSRVNYSKVKHYVKDADLILAQDIGPICMAALKASVKYKKYVVSYVHAIEWELASNSLGHFQGIVRFIVRWVARWFYNKTDLIITPTKEATRILESNKILTSKVVVYLGIKPDKFIPSPDKAESKKLLGINPERTVIGFTGRLGREKDLVTLYRAFLRLDRKYDNLTLLIVGDGLENQKKKLSKKNVMLVGAKDDVIPYLQAMDIYVLPSITETSSLSTMEAMSCGLPVVTTRVGFVKYYIKDKVNGLLFPKRNPVVLKMKLEGLIADKKLRESLGKEARKTIIEKHRWQTTVERIKKVLAGF